MGLTTISRSTGFHVLRDVERFADADGPADQSIYPLFKWPAGNVSFSNWGSQY
jgi:hypothetical protein